MTSPEYQAPIWVNEDDPDFIEGVSPDLGAGYLNQLSGAVEDHGQRLGAITPVVTYLNANSVTQDAGDNRWILQDNANGFAPAEATANALAGKQPLNGDLTALAGLDSTTAGTVATDGAGWVKKTYAQLKTALGLVKGDIGLGSVDNTSDANKPVSAATQTALDGKAARPVTVAGLTYPLVLPHRGAGSAIVPENTMTAFRAGAAYGLGAVDGGDLYLTADNIPISVHNSTVDSIVPATGNVSDYTAAAFAGLPSLVMDPETWFGGNAYSTSTGLRCATWEQIASELGNKVVLWPEMKIDEVGPFLAESITRHRMQKSVVVQSFSPAGIAAFRVACPGAQTCLLMNSGANSGATAASVAAAGHEWVGIDYAWASFAAKAAEFTAAGINVAAFTIHRQHEYDAAVAAGAKVIFSDNPLYCGRLYSRYRRTSDSFRSQTWDHGLIPSSGGAPYISSGLTWTAPNRLKFPGNLQTSILLGSVSPIANAATTYQIDVNVTFDALGSDGTRWAGIFFAGATDHAYNDAGVATDNGYLLFLRANGQMQLFKRVNGPSTEIGTGQFTAAPTAGQTVPLRIQVTPTQVVATRVDTAQSIPVSDTAQRGGYLHLFKSQNTGLSVSWDSLVVS